jgi:RND family efflux transporter MFP subunit
MNVESAAWHRESADAERMVLDGAAARKRRRTIIIAAVVAAGALVLLLAYLFLFRGDSGTPVIAPASAIDSAVAPTVTVIVPGRRPIAKVITATGSLAARRDLPVGVAGEGGMVQRVLVEAGAWVGKGQVLAVIDRSVQAEEAQQLSAGIEVSRADAALAQQELERAQALVGRGFISQADLQRKVAARDAANARVRVARAQLGQNRARIGRLDIRAPAAGLVLERKLEAGQVVSSGSGALFRIAERGEMELIAKLPQEDIARVSAGRAATVIPVGSDKRFEGSVWQVSPVIDPQTRMGAARIAIPYAPELRPGGFASAEIRAGSVDAPVLPQSAVQSDDKGNYVYLVDQNNVVVRRAIRTGEVSDAGIAVIEGLSGNERVVLSASAFLQPGQKVVPKKAR